MNKQLIEKLSSQYHYDIVRFSKRWNNFDVFVAENKAKEGKEPIIGYPIFILVQEETSRLATPDETLEILEIHPVDTTHFSGETL